MLNIFSYSSIHAIGNLIFNDNKSLKFKYETTLYFICHTFIVNEKCAYNFQIFFLNQIIILL